MYINLDQVDPKRLFWYNYYTMKKVKKLQVLKHRAHSILFARDLPFRPKTEQNHMLYKRHTKHRKQVQD
jgi:hypothetical protein